MVLDSDEGWELEDFQVSFLRDFFAGYAESWLIVPEGNGKTTLLAGLALYHAKYATSAFVPIAASSREQAEVMYRQAEGFVIRTPQMWAKSKTQKSGYLCQEGYRRIRCLDTGGRIQVFAADDRTADGVIPTLALVDELHRHKDLRLYRTWRGKLEKRDGQIVTISTAGEPASDFEDTRAKILRESELEQYGEHGEHIRAEADGLVLHDWAVRERDRADDMAVAAAANPRATITAEKLGEKRASKTMTDEHWQRFVCNLATRMSGQAIAAADWDALAEPDVVPDRQAWSIGWIDLGWKIDTTALGILVWEADERRVIAGVKILEPPVDESDIVLAMVARQREFDPVGWVYDPNAGGQQMAKLLDSGRHPDQDGVEFNLFEHPQANAPMALAAQRFDEAIRKGWIVHDGDEVLRRHIQNAVRKSLGGEQWRYDRPPDARGEKRRRYPNDALIGVVMGHSVAVAEHERTTQQRIYQW